MKKRKLVQSQSGTCGAMLGFVLFLALFLVPWYAAMADTNVSGDINTNTTWDLAGSPYIVTSDVHVRSNATLTIYPGVEVRLNHRKSLWIGYLGSMGKLVANGTAGNEIHFTASDSTKPWSRIYYSEASNESSLTHAVIENGGSSTEMIIVYNCDPVIQNCIIQNSASDGLRLRNAQPVLASNTYQYNNGYPINTIYGGNSIPAVDDTSMFTGNTDNRIRYSGGDITENIRIMNPEIPYFMDGDVHVKSNATLTIDPEVKLQFAPDKSLWIGYLGSMGKLVANGTAGKEILFTASDSTNPWSRIYFSEASNESSLTHAVIEKGGSSTEMIIVYNCDPVIQNCIIQNSASDGLRLRDAQPALASNTYQNNNGYPINAIYGGNSISAVDDTSVFTGNTDNRIRYSGGDITENIRIMNPEIPYFMDGDVHVHQDAVLTIDHGVKLQFAPDKALFIGYSGSMGTLIAQGTDDANIIFTSSETVPTPDDYWRGIFFKDNVGDDSIIEHAVVEYGGKNVYGNIYVSSSSPTIKSCTIRHSAKNGIYVIGPSAAPDINCNTITENDVGIYVNYSRPIIYRCTIRHSATYGIYVTGSSAAPDINCNIITENDVGIYVTSDANPLIHDSDIKGNTTCGVQNDNSSVEVFAKEVYWGAADGPSGAGPGSGDAVSANVNYDPFLTSSAPCTGDLNPSFSAEPTEGCQDLTVNFTDTSTGAITAWEWDFDGDGVIDSNVQHPAYTYTDIGTYTVTLTVYEGTESDTATQDIKVTESIPTADFEGVPLSGTTPLTVKFTDISKSKSCGTDLITGWDWDFDNDGIIDSNEQNPSKTFYDVGSYTVTLTVTDEDGDHDTETKVYYVTVGGCTINGILGDLDGDCDVDGDDRNILRASFRKCEGDSGYNADADYDGDGCVTFADYQIWYGYYKAAKLP